MILSHFLANESSIDDDTISKESGDTRFFLLRNTLIRYWRAVKYAMNILMRIIRIAYDKDYGYIFWHINSYKIKWTKRETWYLKPRRKRTRVQWNLFYEKISNQEHYLISHRGSLLLKLVAGLCFPSMDTLCTSGMSNPRARLQHQLALLYKITN